MLSALVSFLFQQGVLLMFKHRILKINCSSIRAIYESYAEESTTIECPYGGCVECSFTSDVGCVSMADKQHTPPILEWLIKNTDKWEVEDENT